MPTQYSDQFFLIDPFSPPPDGTTLTPVQFELVDQNDNDTLTTGEGDMIDGTLITSSYPGDTITVDVPGVGPVTYVGQTFYLADGRRVFTPTDDQVLQEGGITDATYVTSQGPLPVERLGPPCFAVGTMIDTPDGPVVVEKLKAGDQVMTRDHGAQTVRWCSSRHLAVGELSDRPELRPIIIPVGALGDGIPRTTLTVSPQHRVLLASRTARRMFGTTEVLVAAKHLVGVNGIVQAAPEAGVTYVHFMFDDHEVVMSNGAPTESMYAGPMALAGLSAAARRELLSIFPEMAEFGREAPVAQRPARRLLEGREGRKVAAAHERHARPLLEQWG